MDDETRKYIDDRIKDIYGPDPRIEGTGGIYHWSLYVLREEIWKVRDSVNNLVDKNKNPIMIRMKEIEERFHANQIGLQNVYDQFKRIEGIGGFELGKEYRIEEMIEFMHKRISFLEDRLKQHLRGWDKEDLDKEYGESIQERLLRLTATLKERNKK